MLTLPLLVALMFAPPDSSPPNAKDWPADRVEVKLTREEARETLRALTLNLPITGEAARATIVSLERQLKSSDIGHVPMPKRFHDEWVDLRDDLRVVDVWQITDRFGRSWIGDDPWRLRAFVEMVNVGRYVPDSYQPPYRWIPWKRDDINWPEWRRARKARNAK